jgi:Otopetrin
MCAHIIVTLQVHIDRREPLIRFGLMHVIATNMSVWLRTLINEIMNEYHHMEHANAINKQAATGDNSTVIGKKCSAMRYDCIEELSQ